MRRALGSIAAAAALLPAAAAAQDHPWPGSVDEPLVVCTGCPGANADLPLWPYAPPLLDHVGRFVDSSRTKDWQTRPRTYRAAFAHVDEARGRIYMKIGTTFAMHERDAFFARLGSPLTATPQHGDQYLPWEADVYPERPGSGWETRIMDGQEFLGGFDVDDRGFDYLAYTVFGFGIVADPEPGRSFADPLFQDFYPIATPQRVLALRGASGAVYAITSSGAKAQVYDATVPEETTSLRDFDLSVGGWAKMRVGDVDLVAVTRKPGGLDLYETEALAAGGAPFQSFEGYHLVTAGEGAFYSLRRGSSSTPATHLVTVARDPETGVFSASEVAIAEPFYPAFIRWGAGHVTAGSTSGTGKLHVWRLEDAGPVPLVFDDFFAKHYVTPPAGWAKPDGYTAAIRDAVVTRHAGKLYLVYSNDGIGDVFELEAPVEGGAGGAGGAPSTGDGGGVPSGAGGRGGETGEGGGGPAGGDGGGGPTAPGAGGGDPGGAAGSGGATDRATDGAGSSGCACEAARGAPVKAPAALALAVAGVLAAGRRRTTASRTAT